MAGFAAGITDSIGARPCEPSKRENRNGDMDGRPSSPPTVAEAVRLGGLI